MNKKISFEFEIDERVMLKKYPHFEVKNITEGAIKDYFFNNIFIELEDYETIKNFEVSEVK